MAPPRDSLQGLRRVTNGRERRQIRRRLEQLGNEAGLRLHVSSERLRYLRNCRETGTRRRWNGGLRVTVVGSLEALPKALLQLFGAVTVR